MDLKYLNKLSKEELEKIAGVLKFQSFGKGYRKGSSIRVEKDCVIFTSWDEDYSSPKDFDYNIIKINDFLVLGLNLAFDYQKEIYYNYQNYMLSKFYGTEYEKDREAYFKHLNQLKIESNKQKIKQLEKENQDLEKN